MPSAPTQPFSTASTMPATRRAYSLPASPSKGAPCAWTTVGLLLLLLRWLAPGAVSAGAGARARTSKPSTAGDWASGPSRVWRCAGKAAEGAEEGGGEGARAAGEADGGKEAEAWRRRSSRG